MKNINYYFVFIIFFNSILVIHCSILNIPTDKYAVYRDILAELLTQCHRDYKNVIFFDDRHENDYQILSTTLFNTYIKVNSTINHESEIEEYERFAKTNIDVVIVSIYHPGFIVDFIKTLKSLHLTNIETPFYIFSRLRTSCHNRKVILELAWDYKQSIVFFICTSYPKAIPLIYTFNPHANYAPTQWTLLTDWINPKDTFRCFNRVYTKGSLCRGLDFDCTKYLSKNTIMKLGIELDDATQRIAPSMEWRVFSEEYITRMFYDTIILDLLKTYMNLDYQGIFIQQRTLRAMGYTRVFRRGYSMGVDLILFKDEIMRHGNYTMTYPYKIVNYKIIAVDRGLQNFFEYIYYLLGPPMLITMGVLLILTFFVVWLLSKKRSIAIAALEIVRLLIDASLEIEMNTASLKIFFMMIFLYFLIIQTLFQGELARFFTNPPHIEYPTTLDKLINLKYKHIIYTRDIAQYMKEFKTPDNNHSIVHIPYECHEYILNDSMNACVLESQFANFWAMYHVRSSPVVHRSFRFYLTRDDSPIKERLNKAFVQLWESGFSILISNNENNVYMEYLNRMIARKGFRWAKIRNRNLRFMYIFWGVGLTLATLSFIVELIIYNRKKIRESFSEKKESVIMTFNLIRVVINILMVRHPVNNEEEEKN